MAIVNKKLKLKLKNNLFLSHRSIYADNVLNQAGLIHYRHKHVNVLLRGELDVSNVDGFKVVMDKNGELLPNVKEIIGVFDFFNAEVEKANLIYDLKWETDATPIYKSQFRFVTTVVGQIVANPKSTSLVSHWIANQDLSLPSILEINGRLELIKNWWGSDYTVITPEEAKQTITKIVALKKSETDDRVKELNNMFVELSGLLSEHNGDYKKLIRHFLIATNQQRAVEALIRILKTAKNNK